MKKITGALLLITLTTGIFCIVPQAEAVRKAKPAKQETSVSLTPIFGGYLFDNSERLEPAPQFGIKLGYDIINHSIFDSIGIEATYNYILTKSKDDSGNVNGNLFRLDVTYPFTPRDKVVPFLAVGLGGINLNGPSHSETRPLLNYGAGVKYSYEDYLALRMDVRHLLVYHDINTRNNFEVSLGLSYYFGKERKKAPEALPDKDKDGVPDNIDQCGNTPRGVRVDKSGCPVDSDKDGISDDRDKCPDTPEGVTVTPDGCPENGKKDDTKPATDPARVPPAKAAATDRQTASPEKVTLPAALPVKSLFLTALTHATGTMESAADTGVSK